MPSALPAEPPQVRRYQRARRGAGPIARDRGPAIQQRGAGDGDRLVGGDGSRGGEPDEPETTDVDVGVEVERHVRTGRLAREHEQPEVVEALEDAGDHLWVAGRVERGRDPPSRPDSCADRLPHRARDEAFAGDLDRAGRLLLQLPTGPRRDAQQRATGRTLSRFLRSVSHDGEPRSGRVPDEPVRVDVHRRPPRDGGAGRDEAHLGHAARLAGRCASASRAAGDTLPCPSFDR